MLTFLMTLFSSNDSFDSFNLIVQLEAVHLGVQ